MQGMRRTPGLLRHAQQSRGAFGGAVAEARSGLLRAAGTFAAQPPSAAGPQTKLSVR